MLTLPAFFALFAGVAIVWGVPEQIAEAYLVASVFCFLLYAWDKNAARRGWQRISEGKLHLLALFGGWPGALLAQKILRHKTVKVEFRRRFWISVILNVAGFVFLTSPVGRGLLFH